MVRPLPRRAASCHRHLPTPWTNVRDAFELGHRAPQLLSSFHGFVPVELEPMDRDEPMSEDCLMLNVWTPSVDARRANAR